jgi:hypothetical protein
MGRSGNPGISGTSVGTYPVLFHDINFSSKTSSVMFSSKITSSKHEVMIFNSLDLFCELTLRV